MSAWSRVVSLRNQANDGVEAEVGKAGRHARAILSRREAGAEAEETADTGESRADRRRTVVV
jgi:hypothetical protein